jgi:hypothetical protein
MRISLAINNPCTRGQKPSGSDVVGVACTMFEVEST